ncbi:SPFH domain-containing protein [Streptococcus infantis]|uniref:SPFH domain-containing protein n=1 Tax=Streptococcus infantis TaxID=68892 RepID=UPI001CBF0084|nr:SPFH domain-containing protein [Streptococcus infantis]MBZ2119939.1 SPFH domain-containing protein [Streptococcus infantis]MBZ2121758.1 SPFH domain-containing protein [Streptococcus infantis]MBZ2125663.1 SPFH domain-containing protein [Streptococcus infantis]
MGFIRAALSAGLNSFNDSKFKEAVVLPDHVSSDVMAIKGQLLTKDPDGSSRQSNQNTGLLTDGSVIIVPQGYVAVLVNNGTFLGDVLEAGSHEWRAGDNAWLLEKGGIKGTWENFKNRFSFGGQVITRQEIIFIRMQPIAGNKFGTQNAVEYFSERYQQLLNIRFYGLFDIKVADPVLFYVSSISQQIEDHKPFTIQDIAQGTLRQNISPKIAIAIAKYTNENGVDIYSLNANQDTFNEIAKQEVNKVWTGLYGIEATNILLEDLSYDQESLELVRKLDSELVAMKYNTIEIEERRARNEALIAAANNEGNGNGMNMFMGMNLGQTLGGQLTQQAQPVSPNQTVPPVQPADPNQAFTPVQTASPEQAASPVETVSPEQTANSVETTTQEVTTSAEESTSPEQTTNSKQTANKNFYIEVDGKYVLVTKDEEGNIVPVN